MRPGVTTKRKLETDQDPDYEDAPTISPSKKPRTKEEDAAREMTVKKIEAIIKKKFAIEGKQREKEIELIDERIHQVRVMLDKLRACVVASYYGNIKSNSHSEKTKPSKVDVNHPAIRRVMKQQKAALSSQQIDNDKKTANEKERCTPDSEILSQVEDKNNEMTVDEPTQDSEKLEDPGNTSRVPPQREGFRYDVRKRIIVGNVSKYISADQREESDPSTHKWMVYVRGPSNEPSIDHFVKKVWFFLHPSYRPNDLVEVKEPPFHLTRRGWGEFPIRIQLHFVDPRNKKVDIIHQIKLDRTYTGLQTLGAETIVDVELDRYLTDNNGFNDFPRPASPAITNVNYREGSKPQISSLSISGSSTSSPSTATTPMRQRSVSHPISPKVSKARKEALDKMVDTLNTEIYLESSMKSIGSFIMSDPAPTTPKQEKEFLSNSGTFAAVIPERKKDILIVPMETDSSNSTMGVSSEDSKYLSSSHSTSTTRTMPPLGPITSGLRMSQSSGIRLEKVAEKCETHNLGTKVSEELQDAPDGAVNVADMASETSPGKMAIRIRHGKVVPSSEEESKEEMDAKISPPPTDSSPTTSTAKTIVTAASVQVGKQIAISSTPSGTSSQLPSTSTAAQILSEIATSEPKLVTTEKPTIVTAVKKVQGTSQSKKSGSQVAIPQPPPGTQYYITATSSDPNLQGKVILIPQQVFSQASTQQKTTVGKVTSRSPANKTPQTALAKPGATGKKATGAATKGPFLSPSNVLILPQGSIVPPLPSGSIVQIQQVPTQANKATLVRGKSPSIPTKGVSPSKQQAPKLQTVHRSMTPTTGLIQVQRTPKTGAIHGQAVTKQASQGVSLLPDQKGQLVRTQSGGVVLMQRSSGSRQQGTSGMTQVKIAHHIPILTQKVSSAVLPSATSTKTMVTVGQSVLPSTGQSIVIATPKSLSTLSQADTQVTKVISTKGVSLITGQIGVVKESGVIRSSLPTAKKIQETGNVVKVQGLTILGGKSCLSSISGLSTGKEILKPGNSVESIVKNPPALATGSELIAAIPPSTGTAPSKKDSLPFTSIGVSSNMNTSGIKQDFLKKFIITPVKQETKPSAQQVVHHVMGHQSQGQSTTVLSEPKFGVRTEKSVEVPPKKGIDLKEVSSMENLVKAVVKRIPMINKISDPTIFPFCATSVEQFHSWHIIKRKACEWQRAVAIKENVKKLISDSKECTFNLTDVWTTKRIMVWCRNHGYMPYVKDKTSAIEWCDICGEVKKVISDEGKDETEEHSTQKCKERWLSELGYLKSTSYSSPDELRSKIESKQEESKNGFQDSDDLEIDVISVKSPSHVIIKSEPSVEPLKPKVYMPPSEGAILIEEMCQQIGIKLKQVEASEDVFIPATQEMIFNAAKQFMSDLVRDSLAEAYKCRSDCRPPQEILPNDVYRAVTSSPSFELLTNKHLGVQTRSGNLVKEEEEDE
ncbi:YEATS domain-containing protein 2-like [Anneissia japonica]|uniref:YEATS domain-containing protein 2-like n=1 Tax=Anneissia japonica TaxID=1529436 RepID=UPI0014258214|nr:YEATS domain-containing protein 2-like [Anneissia japonica]